MLIESLLLLLVEQRILLKEQVIEAIDGVTEIKQEIAGTSENVVVSMVSISLLRTIAGSVRAVTVAAEPTLIP